ncbi:MAG: hypothetical protein DWQ19_09305 [Crenarchaeota archaeon]|nr:MAG: hypothetical protein DWQ19_09305 [Thermoproteota archaeon]
MIKKTLHGPKGAILILDQAQVFPDDPGAGTPAMVKYRNNYSTYWCCINEGVCDEVELPQEVMDWLDSEAVENEIKKIGA